MLGTITKIVDDPDRARKDDSRYGFIRDEAGRDRFFHLRDLRDCTFSKDLEGTRVEFDAFVVTRDDNSEGLRATNVRPLFG